MRETPEITATGDAPLWFQVARPSACGPLTGPAARRDTAGCHNDAAAKAARFNNSYKNRTGAEVAAGMEEVKAAADQQVAQGKLDQQTAAGAKAVGDAVAGGPLGGGFKYEEVEGPWDKALFDTGEQETTVGSMKIKSFTNTLHVLVSNMDFSVEYQTREAASHKEQVVALAEAIVEHLKK